MSFWSNWMVKNLVGAVAFVAAIVIGVSILLNAVTRHGQEVAVPDLSNLSVPEAQELAAKSGLEVVVADSVYIRRMQKGAVFSQNPKAGSRVKDGRTIRVNINASNSKKVSMPDLVGYSMRQAKAELSSKGLYLGRIIYIRDMATNNVIKQLYRNAEILPGTMIESGANVDLVVGLSDTENRTIVPDVRGMRCLRAIDAVHNNSLNIGRLKFDASVKTYSDSLNAVVLSQSPAPRDASILMGSEVSLSLSLDPELISKVMSSKP